MLFFLLINVKMPTTVGILTLMSRKNFMLSWAELDKIFGPGLSQLHLFISQLSSTFSSDFSKASGPNGNNYMYNLTFVTLMPCLYVLLCGPNIHNKDSCILYNGASVGCWEYKFNYGHTVRRRGRVVKAARLWCRKSPYRASSRLGCAMRRLENSVNPAENGYLFRIREG